MWMVARRLACWQRHATNMVEHDMCAVLFLKKETMHVAQEHEELLQ